MPPKGQISDYILPDFQGFRDFGNLNLKYSLLGHVDILLPPISNLQNVNRI